MTTPTPDPDAAVEALRLAWGDGTREFVLPANPCLRAVVLGVLEGREYPLLLGADYVPETILDVGANVGAAAVLFRGAYPGARIHCFEPAPDNLAFLRRNLAGLDGVTVHPYGLLDRDATLPLYRGRDQSAQHSLVPSAETGGPAPEVPLRRASAAVRALGIRRISILKLDTEGAELPILSDLLPAVDAIDVIYVEYHSAEDRRAIDRLLAEGYELARGTAESVHRGRVVYLSRDMLRRHPALDAGRIDGSRLGEPAGASASPGSGGPREVALGFEAGGRALEMVLRLDPAAFSQRIMYAELAAGRFYEPELSYFLTNVLREGDGVVDVGGHVGYFTVLAARVVGERGRVYAFEPEAANYARLVEHLTLNRLTNVVPHLAAVSDAPGELELHVNLDNDGGHALWDVARHALCVRSRSGHPVRRVPATTLDLALGAVRGPRIRLVKVDAEGAEYAVLRGAMRAILAHEVPFVVCEINEFGLRQLGASSAALRRFMEVFGYRAYRMSAEPPHLVPLEEDLPPAGPVFNVLFTNQPVPA